MFGFLNIYKPKGLTSHDVVARLRRITKIKQIGHTGTLDPFAEGVLPICIGKATRLIEYLEDNKAYEGTIQFGSATTTYDLEGDITLTSDKKISLEQIEDAIEKLQKRTKDISNVNDFLLSPSGMEKLDAACMLLIAIEEGLKQC